MAYVARVTCPACGAAFQTPVEQILDVRMDPQARQRIMSGAVNVARCPACGTAGALNVPFLYHDPEKEVALLYLPMEAGRTEVERQELAGTLTRQLMNTLPPEERKGYLLQPETFIGMESLMRRVLELEGISEEQMERNRAQQELLSQLLEVEPESWPELLEEHADIVDEQFFSLVNYLLRASASEDEESEPFVTVRRLYEHLLEHTEIGQLIKKRSDAVRPFMEDPNQETFIAALLAAPDSDAVDTVIQMGLPLLDYGFFQKLNQRIEQAEDEERAAQLKAVRRRVLDVRDEIQQATQEVVGQRAQLLRKLVRTEEPLKMARSHLSELDDTFAYVLQTQLQQAQEAGDQRRLEELMEVAQLLERVMEENMPPEMALARRLLMAPDDEQLRNLLEENRPMLTPPFLQFLEALEQGSLERGDTEVAERLAEIRAEAAQMMPARGAQPGGGAPQRRAGDDEERTPSGLIIAKK